MFCLVFVYFVSSAVRLNQHNYILHSHDHNVDGHIILSGNDGYRWLRYADEIKNGSFKAGAEDVLSGSPDHVRNPPVKPLISVMIYRLADMTGKSHEEAAGLLTVFLSGLFIFPLGALLWSLGLTAAAVGGAVTGSLCFAYLSRTAGFQPDTDMLNLFFPFLIALCVYHARRRPYVFSALSGLSAYVYYLWYFHSGMTLVWFAVLAAALVSAGRSKKEIAFSLMLYIVLSGVVTTFKGIAGIYEFTANSGVTYGTYVSELRHVGFLESLRLITADGWSALFGLLICFLLVKRLWVTLPVFLLGLLVFFRGERFGMYMGVFAGIGIGGALQYLFAKIHAGRMLSMASALFFCLLIVRPFLSFIPAPYVSADVFDGIYRTYIPKGAVVIAHWDYGFLIEYLKGVPCSGDGATQYKIGRDMTDRLMASKDANMMLIKQIADGRDAYIITTGADAAKFIRGGFLAEVSDSNDVYYDKKKISVRSAGEKNLIAKYDAEHGKLMIFNNKTQNSFFGKMYVIESSNVHCIHSVALNQPAIRVYEATRMCYSEK